jgi:hypothetical protein
MAARLLHHLKRPGLEHLNWLYVDVAVSDLHLSFLNPEPADLAGKGAPTATLLPKHHDSLFVLSQNFSGHRPKNRSRPLQLNL